MDASLTARRVGAPGTNFKRYYPFLLLATGVLLGALVTKFAGLVTALGFRIPQSDMPGDYLTGVFWAVGIAVSIPFWPVTGTEKKALLRLWIVRCWITLGFMLFYEYNYGLDAYWYFDESRRPIFDFTQLEPGNGIGFIQSIIWSMNHYLPIYGSYHAEKVLCSLVGFLGVFVFYRACTMFLRQPNIKLLYILMLTPSILFWSSILGKDPIHWFGIALYLYGGVGWMRRRKFHYLAFMAAGLGINVMLRIWAAFIFLAPFGIVSVWRMRNFVLRVIMLGLFLAAGAMVVQKISAQFSTQNVDQLVKNTNSISRSWSRGGGGQEVPVFTSLGDMIKFAPLGMFTAIYRPLPGEILNPFGLMAGIENLLLLGMLIFAIRRGGFKGFDDDVILWSVVMVIIWSFFYAFISFQNLGAASRFKLQVLPVVVSLTLYFFNQAKNNKDPHVRNRWRPRARF